MSKLWQRIKNAIIKKLGGFTKDEYGPITRYEFLPPRTVNNVVVLRAEGTFSPMNNPPKEWIEEKLIAELARQMKPHVLWEHNDHYCDMTRTFRATVTVVADHE